MIYGNGKVLNCLPVEQKEFIVGSGEDCSLRLIHSSINKIHAQIAMDEKGGKIIDLSSGGGIKINGKEVKEGHFGVGDRLSIGAVKLLLVDFEDEEGEQREEVERAELVQMPTPPSPVQSPVTPMPSHGGLQLIDGEYCDITFDDSSFAPLSLLPTQRPEFAHRDYIDISEEGARVGDIVQGKQKSSSIEVSVLLNGHILSMDYLPLKDASYFVGPLAKENKTIALGCLDGKKDLPFIKIKNSHVEVQPPPQFKGRYLEGTSAASGGNLSLNSGDLLSLEWKTVQIFIRHNQAPPTLKRAPFFSAEEGESKKVAKVFSTLMSVLLLLLLVDTTKKVERPKKKIAVIYRTKPEPKPIPIKKSVQPEKMAGEKKKDEPKKVAAKKPEPKKAKKLAKKPPRKKKVRRATSRPARQKTFVNRVAKSSPPKKAPIKSYSFSAKGQLKNLFLSAKSAKSDKLLKSTTGSSASSTSPQIARDISSVGNLPSAASSRNAGTGLKGYDRSVGSQGLSNKRGVSRIAQTPPKVVEGSMDPEILQRLLQEYMPQFKHCYQQELERNRKAKGVVDLKFRIVAKGKIAQVRVGKKKGQVFSSTGTKCLGNVLSLIEFPAPKGGGVVDVKQPLNFLSSRRSISSK